MVFLITPIARFFNNTYIFTWDALLELTNQVLPKRKEGHVVPEGHPGFGGIWPEYIPPKDGDSRCCCPGLNAFANHGLVPRDGRNISFKEAGRLCHDVFNFSPSFSYYTANFAATVLNKSYSKDTFDLEDLSLHNGIEHDASLTRLDYAFDKGQGKPHLPYIRELLDSASGKDKEGNVLFTMEDLARFSAKRRIDSRASNPEFSLDLNHRMFASGNTCTFLSIFGGRQKDIEIILTEERIPEGWEPRNRKQYGLTLTAFNTSVIPLEYQTSGLVKTGEANAVNHDQNQEQN
ncbi:Chloroperoxidase [Amanita rubescens]|nr:Chloroperoxidase [Amanita rubescens]